MVIHPSYYDACDVSCDVIYYVIAVRARRMVRIFFLPYLGNRSKSDPRSYELFCLELHILSFPKVLQIPPESPCIYTRRAGLTVIYVKTTSIRIPSNILDTVCFAFPCHVLRATAGTDKSTIIKITHKETFIHPDTPLHGLKQLHASVLPRKSGFQPEPVPDLWRTKSQCRRVFSDCAYFSVLLSRQSHKFFITHIHSWTTDAVQSYQLNALLNEVILSLPVTSVRKWGCRRCQNSIPILTTAGRGVLEGNKFQTSCLTTCDVARESPWWVSSYSGSHLL